MLGNSFLDVGDISREEVGTGSHGAGWLVLGSLCGGDKVEGWFLWEETVTGLLRLLALETDPCQAEVSGTMCAHCEKAVHSQSSFLGAKRSTRQ